MYYWSLILTFYLTAISSFACSPGEYDDNGCQPCNVICLQCNGGSSSQCTKCSSGSFLTNTNTCSASCITGYIPNSSTNKCDKCHSSCSDCINTTSTCTSCASGKVFFTINNTCLNSCPIYYKNSSGICTIIFCATQCGNCSGINYYNCTDCFVGFDYYSDVSDCTPYNDYYYIALQTSYLTSYSNSSSVFNCGPYLNIPGKFSPQQVILLFSLSNLKPHVSFRLMMWLLWVDQWDNNDYIHFTKQDLSEYFKVNYTSASLRQSKQCGDSNYFQRLSIVDANRSHNQSSITVVAYSDPSPYSTSGWGYKQILLLLMKCHRYCQICTSTSNSACSVCALYEGYKYLLSGTTCAYNCLETYYFHLPWNCTPCTQPCYSCKDNGTYCLKCITNHVFFPPNNTCPEQCPPQYYFNSTTNQCEPCYELCYLCTGFPSPCQKCQPDIYFMKYNNTCWNPCPSTFQHLDMQWLCLLPNDYFVNLSISFQKNQKSLLITLKFTHQLNMTNLGIESFQSIIFKNSAVTLDKFNVIYKVINNKTYTIQLIPIGIIFMRRVPVTLKTRQNHPNFTTFDGLSLSNSCFNYTSIYPWTILQPPQTNTIQKQLIGSLSYVSSAFNQFWNLKSIQDIKQLGLFLIMFNYLQIPAMIMLLNIIYPTSFYEGTRILASFVLVDIPQYEQQSNKVRYVMRNQWYNVDIQSRRLLQNVQSPLLQWRFGRTGFIGNFIIDCYGSMILLFTAVILLVLSHFSLRYFKKYRIQYKLDKINSYLYCFLHRVNEVVLFSFVLSIYFEVLYFKSSGIRILSAFLCAILNIYLLAYQTKTFYELHNYSEQNKQQTNLLIHKYGSMLKWIRYDYKTSGNCLNKFKNIRQLFQPYNYHTLSYYKKALMLLSICMFYDYPIVQISIIITLQILQMIRFLLTLPYNSKIRNYTHFILQIILLSLFVLILISLTMINKILVSTDLILNYSIGSSWIKIGWLMVTLLWLYCLSHLIIDIIGLYYKYKYTNSQLYWMNAKKYYYGKLQQYQQHNIQAPTKLITQFINNIKVNNINNTQQKEDNLLSKPNSIQIEIQQVQFTRQKLLSYKMSFKKAISLKMNKVHKLHKLYDKKCNIKIQQRINKSFIITRKDDSILFKLADHNFQTFQLQNKLQSITIKTFVEIDQNKYQPSQNITLNLDMNYSHQVFLKQQNVSITKMINLDDKLTNFPLNQQLLTLVMNSK